jgi:hypothetical protein
MKSIIEDIIKGARLRAHKLERNGEVVTPAKFQTFIAIEIHERRLAELSPYVKQVTNFLIHQLTPFDYDVPQELEEAIELINEKWGEIIKHFEGLQLK